MIDGITIKKLREEKGLTQSELGSQIGTDGNLVSRWERNRAVPSHIYLEKLSELFGKPVDYFHKKNTPDIKERSVTENKGMLTFELGTQRLEVPATSEFSEQFWERVDRMIELSLSTSAPSAVTTRTQI